MRTRESGAGARQRRALLHGITGGALLLVVVFADPLLGMEPLWGPLQTAGVIIAVAFALMGFLPLPGKLGRFGSGVCVALLTALLLLVVAEVGFRAIGYDFDHVERTWLESAPAYRRPTVPTGEVWFRHRGPQTWTGQVIHSEMQREGIRPDPYVDEPVITVEYDAAGFRNPSDLLDWDLVVAGDSFTELGHLPYEELFTTILGEELGLRVKNLGTCQTGTLSQVSYLRDFGISAKTRHVLIVFYEGNDLNDLGRQYAALESWRETGERPTIEFTPQSSFSRALRDALGELLAPQPQGEFVFAHFEPPTGESIPVSMLRVPPGTAELSEQLREALPYSLDDFATMVRELGLTPWLAYMPCKRRTWDAYLVWTEKSGPRLRDWTPTDLPDHVRTLCEERDIGFIDLSPALRRESERGALLYNPIWDNHLNAEGSRVVARVLTEHFKAVPQAD